VDDKICEIYDKRPDICRRFPTTEYQIKDFDKCTYYFKDGMRKGSCCGCGQCCVNMPWPDGKDDICRYLK